jgi:hypothetical protein
MRNIVVVGVSGSGINFLKNIFFLSDKLKIESPRAGNDAVMNRVGFIIDYYKELLEKTKNNENWIDHEWLMRLGQWSDKIDQRNCLIKIDVTQPTVFVMHSEKEILIDDSIIVVFVVVDDKKMCETLFKAKSNRSWYTIEDVEKSDTAKHPNREYYKILFSDLFNDPNAIFELTKTLELDIKLSDISEIHSLWKQSNNLLLENYNKSRVLNGNS